jgi:hypothetical protein
MTSLSSWRRGHMKPSGIRLCNWPGCTRPVPQSMWGCRTHWFTLPDGIRYAIQKAYNPSELANPAWRCAHSEALDWIEANMEQAKASRNITPLPPEKPPCSS